MGRGTTPYFSSWKAVARPQEQSGDPETWEVWAEPRPALCLESVARAFLFSRQHFPSFADHLWICCFIPSLSVKNRFSSQGNFPASYFESVQGWGCTQWQSVYLECLRPGVQSSGPPKQKATKDTHVTAGRAPGSPSTGLGSIECSRVSPPDSLIWKTADGRLSSESWDKQGSWAGWAS